MSMTMTQKILADKCKKDQVAAGELILAQIDLALGNDITSPAAINEFSKTGFSKVFDNNKIAIVLDHFTPNKDIKAAKQCSACRQFANEHNIKNFFDVGKMGIEHVLLPETGLVIAGDAVVGADSHTCTYGALGAFSTGVGSTDLAAAMAMGKAWFKVPSAIKVVISGKPLKYVSGKDIILDLIGKIGVDGALYKSLEFTGDGLKYLSMDDRFTIANMAIEAGAKNGIFEVDDITLDYISVHSKRKPKVFKADNDAFYDSVITIELDKLKPTVACPSLPSNTCTADKLSDVKIDQVVIGSCTNGRISDLKIAAEILKGKSVKQGVRAIVIPGSQQVYLDALKAGYIEIFIKAGCVVSTPTCGPCLGGHMGVLSEGEVAISTTNRNFVGRMGHTKSKVYLSSPAVAAASAVSGYITNPVEVDL